MDKSIERGDQLAQLHRTLPYKWRLKQVANKAKRPYPDGTRGQFLAYIDARAVYNILDDVMKPENWKTEVKRVNDDGSVIVALSLFYNGEWRSKEDAGYPNNPGSDVEDEPLKAAVSDGVKRAAVQWGIGRFLYELPPVWTGVDPSGQPLKPIGGSVAATSAPAEYVDPESGEIRAAAPAAPVPESQQCAMDGCAGVCVGAWVDFSVRRYGVPLCSKHSAMAKRGEIEGELERLNHGAAAYDGAGRAEPPPMAPKTAPAANAAPGPATDREGYWIKRIQDAAAVSVKAYESAIKGWEKTGEFSAAVDAVIFDLAAQFSEPVR